MPNAYALYLDDIRNPPQTGEDWVLCRTLRGMREILEDRGIPMLASFDYELGGTDPGNDGADAVSMFIDYLISNPRKGELIDLEVRLHTSSGYGATRMAQLLKKSHKACEVAGIRLIHRF